MADQGDAVPARPTLADVARLAGVTTSTVSRAMRQPGRISAETTARVLAAVEAAGYEKPRAGDPDSRTTARPRRVRARATIYDVAERAGVNPSTVSRVFSRPGRISAETAERVRSAAGELDYQINPVARALQSGRTRTIAVLTADVTNPVLFGIARGAEREASARGYTLVLAESQESSQVEAETAETLIRAVDGLVLATTRLSDAQIQALAARAPIAVINRRLDGVVSAVPDLMPGIDEALAHLAALGHRDIAFLAGPRDSWMNFARRRVIESHAVTHGLTVRVVESGAPTLDGGRQALPKVVASRCSAVISYNDLMAIGLLLAARDVGLDVPEQLSVIGFDDIFGSDFTSPPLTTIRAPLAELGARAVSHVLDAVGTPRPSSVTATHAPLATELIVRGSTARAGES